MERSRRWAERFFSSAAALPSRLRWMARRCAHSGRVAAGLTGPLHDAALCETVFEGTDPRTGLPRPRGVHQYRDYPVIEWVAWFSNQGQASTPLLSDVLAMDGAFSGSAAELVHCNGDFYSEQGYTRSRRAWALATRSPLPQRGRSCDGAFPTTAFCSQTVAAVPRIGWPATWAASFTGWPAACTCGRPAEDGAAPAAGRNHSARAHDRPSVVGDETRAVNLWRRWYLAHILPPPDGQPLRPLLACAARTRRGVTAATEEKPAPLYGALRSAASTSTCGG